MSLAEPGQRDALLPLAASALTVCSCLVNSYACITTGAMHLQRDWLYMLAMRVQKLCPNILLWVAGAWWSMLLPCATCLQTRPAVLSCFAACMPASGAGYMP